MTRSGERLRSAYRAGHAYGDRRRHVVLREAITTNEATGPDDHTCINLRLPTYGGLYAWEFEKVRASAGSGSFRRKQKLKQYLKEARAQVEAVKRLAEVRR